MFLYLCIIFSRPFAVFLIRLLIMWIPEFLIVYKIRGGRAGGGNGTGGKWPGGNLTGGRGRGGGSPVGKRRGEDAGVETAWYPFKYIHPGYVGGGIALSANTSMWDSILSGHFLSSYPSTTGEKVKGQTKVKIATTGERLYLGPQSEQYYACTTVLWHPKTCRPYILFKI